MKLKRKALGSRGIEKTLPEDEVYSLLVKVGAAKTPEEARGLAPSLDGLCITCKHKKLAADFLRINRLPESNIYVFRVFG